MSRENNKRIPIPGGYVKLARCISNSKISFAPPHIREIWHLLIREANHTDASYRGFHIKAGQLFRSYDDITESLHWRIGWRKVYYKKELVKKAMRYLREHGMIKTKKELGGVLITICNYDFYQDGEHYTNTKDGTKKSTRRKPIKNQECSPYNNNDNNGNTDNKLKEKKYLFDIANSDNLTKYEKYTLKYWNLFKTNFGKNIPDEIKEAEYDEWVHPIKLLITKDKKTFDDLDKVYTFLKEEEFWKTVIYTTSKLREKNKQGIPFFNDILLKIGSIDTLPQKEDFEPILKRLFNRTTPHFINLISDYLIMLFIEKKKSLRGNNLEFHLKKLATKSGNDVRTAVNILRKSLNKKVDIEQITL